MADITEAQAFAALLNGLGNSRDACRALGLLRSDERWIRLAATFDQISDSAKILFSRSRAQGSIPIIGRGPIDLRIKGH